jgi:type VI secretion system secreted protein Hcp
MDALLLNIIDAGIKGESIVDSFKDCIECLSYSHGVAQQITGDQSNTKRTSGKPNHQDFTITKYMDLASTKMIDFCNQAKNIKSMIFTIGQMDSGKVIPQMTITMENVLISSGSVGGGGGGKPQETYTFNYTKITWKYEQQKSDSEKGGNDSAIYDLSTNKPA